MSHSSKTPSRSSRAPSDALSDYSAAGHRNERSDRGSQASNWSNHSSHRTRTNNTRHQEDLSHYIQGTSTPSSSQNSSLRGQSSNPVNQHRSHHPRASDSSLPSNRHSQPSSSPHGSTHHRQTSNPAHIHETHNLAVPGVAQSRRHTGAGSSREHAREVFPKGRPDWVPNYMDGNQKCVRCHPPQHAGTTIKAIFDHVKNMHNPHIRICPNPRCFMVCSNRTTFKSHTKVHGSNAKYKCGSCDAAFIQSATLLNHKPAAHRYKL